MLYYIFIFQRQEAFGEEIEELLLPILIGSAMAVSILGLITFLIVTKKKSQIKYDTEKAQGCIEESQKLKTEDKLSSR